MAKFSISYQRERIHLRLFPKIKVLVGDIFTFSVLIAQLLVAPFLPCHFNLLVQAGDCRDSLYHAEVLPRMIDKHFNPWTACLQSQWACEDHTAPWSSGCFVKGNCISGSETIERQFEKQQKLNRLNDKVHLLHKATPLRLGEIYILSIQRNKHKINKMRQRICSKWKNKVNNQKKI